MAEKFWVSETFRDAELFFIFYALSVVLGGGIILDGGDILGGRMILGGGDVLGG